MEEVKMINKKNILTKPLYYRLLDSKELGSKLNISVIGYEECTKNKVIVDLTKNCYVLHFVIKGKGFFKREKNPKILIEENSCFLIRPGQKVNYYPHKESPWTYFWIEFNGETVEKIINLLEFELNNDIIPFNNYQIIKNYMYDIFNEDLYISNHYSELFRIEGIVNHIFSILFLDSKIKVPNKTSKKEEQIKAIIEYINNNYTSPDITIEEISKKFFFNISYLTRIIKEKTGSSPKKIIIDLRMKTALELLNTKKYTIAEVSKKIGYKNQFYFSREFKEYYGVSPINYKIK